MSPTIKHIHHHENHTIQLNSYENQKTYIEDTVSVQSKSNLFLKQATLLGLWYMFSFFTIVLNKYILTMLGGDPSHLGRTQMLMPVIFGGITIYGLPCFARRTGIVGKKLVFLRNMSILGVLRFGTVVCSLISLKHVAASFTETVKASAPLFTVILSFMILREKVGLLVMFSLIPVMAGLSLCSANEISFNTIGFVAAILNNIMDCIQNVFSKKLLSGEASYSPPELQFYTGAAALLMQIPYWVYTTDFQKSFEKPDYFYVGILMLDSFSFYLQSVTAYGLMALISPITFSVANTVKRTLLIWLSVVVFANHVTWLSGLGTMIVTLGVVLYQKAKQIEARDREQQSNNSNVDHPHR
ncbi:solute carrier family 35 member E2A-like [Dendronephthya gigantea]|uniref:solute carrier family 35 member E2A-like n=1 Tax=Dendronephthya gigantea TaxID=151771 RepID=UPI00106B5318|nr:solute carrier family 35 member E2A-like [Dendronephthya gigantea]